MIEPSGLRVHLRLCSCPVAERDDRSNLGITYIGEDINPQKGQSLTRLLVSFPMRGSEFG